MSISETTRATGSRVRGTSGPAPGRPNRRPGPRRRRISPGGRNPAPLARPRRPGPVSIAVNSTGTSPPGSGARRAPRTSSGPAPPPGPARWWWRHQPALRWRWRRWHEPAFRRGWRRWPRRWRWGRQTTVVEAAIQVTLAPAVLTTASGGLAGAGVSYPVERITISWEMNSGPEHRRWRG